MKSNGSKKTFKYRGPSPETVARRASQRGGSFDNYIDGKFSRFKPKDGKNRIRILPLTWDDMDKWGDNWGIDIFTHRFIGPDNSNFLCLQKMQGKTCPLCQARHQVSSEDEEAADKLKPVKRTLAWIIDRNDEKAGPQFWEVPVKVEQAIQELSKGEDGGGVIEPSHHEEGYDITFKKEGSGLNTQYIAPTIVRDSSPLSDDPDIQQKWLDFIEENPLPEILVSHEASYMKAAYMGQGKSKSEDDEEEDTKPTKRRATPKVEEDEPEEDVDEEEEAPPPRSKPSRRQSVEEEEEEERPQPRARGRQAEVEDEDEEVEEETVDEETVDEEEEDHDVRPSNKATGKAESKTVAAKKIAEKMRSRHAR